LPFRSSPPGNGADGEESDWVVIAHVRSMNEINELELVLIAVGLKTEVRRSFWGYTLLTPKVTAAPAIEQLRLYRAENRRAKVSADPPLSRVSWLGIAGFLALIWSVFLFDQGTFGRVLGYGALQAGAVFDGHWWLTITALTLHADFTHIFANSIFGCVVAWVTCRYFGTGFGLLLILLSGAFGNTLNAVVQPDTFSAIGASTAIFGGVGVICGYVANRRFVKGRSMSLNYAPIIAAVAFFALFGLGTGNTDVVGHLMGLIAGLGLGFVVGYIDPRWLGDIGQKLSLGLTVGLIAVAWFSVLF